DEMMELYLEGTDIPLDMEKRVIRKATISLDIVPVMCGSAFKNKGVQPLLDAVVAYLPSPLDMPHLVGVVPDDTAKEIEVKASADAPFAALAFKIM
ncbi:elongation factor G, partial [Cloacibacillus evryensis]|nr:elongation factor G [Cloacibacillus evryensis]